MVARLARPEASHWTGPGSDLRHASIDGEIHAGDERTFIRGEERDGSRDFLGLAPATHWDLRGELGDRLLDLFRGEAHLLQSRGFDWARAHRIHTNLAVFQLHRPSARKVAHSRLTRGVGAKPWGPQYVRDRRVQDNRTAVFEEGKGLLHRKEHSLH